MTIELTPDLTKIIESRIRAGKFDSAEEVVRAALLATEEHPDVGELDPGAPNHLTVTSSNQMKTLIYEALDNPGRRFTEADIAQMRRELVDHGQISKG